jgi:hypothetical protein
VLKEMIPSTSTFRIAGAQAALALLILLALAGVAAADLKKAEDTRYRVRQVLTIQYSTKYCDKDGGPSGTPINLAYKVNSWSRRWSRRSTRRSVSTATFLAQANGFKCDGDPVQDRTESSWRPCFGCDGNSRRWTPDYHGSPGWPYIYSAEDAAIAPFWALRFSLAGTVSSRARELGEICTRVTLFGIAPSC